MKTASKMFSQSGRNKQEKRPRERTWLNESNHLPRYSVVIATVDEIKSECKGE